MSNFHSSETVMAFAIGSVVGAVIGIGASSVLRRHAVRTSQAKSLFTSHSFSEQDLKMVIGVRMDLKMGKGKIAAQCSHAAVECVCELEGTDEELLHQYVESGQAKVVVKIADESALTQVYKHAKSLGLNACLIRDAGRTQLMPGTQTVVGVGPGPVKLVDKVTGHLKLF